MIRGSIEYKVGRHISLSSADCRPTIDRSSADCPNPKTVGRWKKNITRYMYKEMRAGSIPGYCRQEVFNTSLQTLRVPLASWYHFSNKIAFEAGNDWPTHRPMIRGSIEYKIGRHISRSSAGCRPTIGRSSADCPNPKTVGRWKKNYNKVHVVIIIFLVSR